MCTPSTLMPLARASSAASTRSSTTKATECSTSMACDLFGDVVRQGDDLGDILGFGAQLDETGASVEGLGHDVENRPVAAIVGADHEIEAQVETVAHGWVWERVHCVT